jgi:hypothetical protein
VRLAQLLCGRVKCLALCPTALQLPLLSGLVDDLAVDTLDGFGAIPQPRPDLGHRLEDLVAH